jgi:hypothetical protein
MGLWFISYLAYTSISPLYVKRLFSISTHIVWSGNSAPGISLTARVSRKFGHPEFR